MSSCTCRDLYIVKVNLSNVSGFEYIGFSFEDAYKCFEKNCDIKKKLVVSVELCVTKYPGDSLDFKRLWDLVNDGFFENLDVLCYTSVRALRNVELLAR